MAGNLFGKAVLGVAEQRSVADFARRSALARPLLRRFVAGETLEEALEVAGTLNAAGLTVALDHLGENTSDAAEAMAATDEAVRALELVHIRALDAYVSVKLTQLGLDLGEYVVLEQARRLLARAQALGSFVCLDMEGSSYTARTLELFGELRREYDAVGTVLQAYLYRSVEDARMLVEVGAQVRLVKGAYSEPPHIAFRRKRDTDRNYVRLMEYLLLRGRCPAIATHDEAIIERARTFAQQHGVGRGQFEFQMLYGIRRDLQDDLAAHGYRVRVYVPYGSQWYPYLTRRLAERPANLLSVAGNVLRERRGTA